jgi:hypothetical protein
MKKRGLVTAIVILIVSLLLIIPGITADSVNDEVRKLAHYAEEYETGNIDYPKLLVYAGGIRQKLNEILGVVDQREGGLLKQEQVEEALGEPDRLEVWVWVERYDQEIRWHEPIPRWETVIFDGEKIQIRLEAHPSISMKGFDDWEDEEDREDWDEEDWDEEEKRRRKKEEEERRRFRKLSYDEKLEFIKEEGALIYRLHFQIEFKTAKKQIDFEEKIKEIESLAKKFNSNPSRENAEKLAELIVKTERAFEEYYRETSFDCERVMNDYFGSENLREEQEMRVEELEFFTGEDFEVMGRYEKCVDCEWPFLDSWKRSGF